MNYAIAHDRSNSFISQEAEEQKPQLQLEIFFSSSAQSLKMVPQRHKEDADLLEQVQRSSTKSHSLCTSHLLCRGIRTCAQKVQEQNGWREKLTETWHHLLLLRGEMTQPWRNSRLHIPAASLSSSLCSLLIYIWIFFQTPFHSKAQLISSLMLSVL